MYGAKLPFQRFVNFFVRKLILLSKQQNKKHGHVEELGSTTKRINWLLVTVGHHNKDNSGFHFWQSLR